MLLSRVTHEGSNPTYFPATPPSRLPLNQYRYCGALSSTTTAPLSFPILFYRAYKIEFCVLLGTHFNFVLRVVKKRTLSYKKKHGLRTYHNQPVLDSTLMEALPFYFFNHIKNAVRGDESEEKQTAFFF